MGTWGTKLYENDTSLDVKGEFEKLFRSGKTAEEITEQLTESYQSILEDPEEGPLFWFALADTQWKFGVLLPSVKERALSWIEKNSSPPRCQGIGAPSEKQWKKTQQQLRDRLLSPQPPAKKPVKRRIYTCQWKLGDVFAYPLESELAKERGLYGRYFLIQKVDEDTWYPGHIVPIVYVKLTSGPELPANVEEYNQCEFVQTWFTKYENRFLPIDMSRLKEDLAEKAQMRYEVDEYGFLPEYRVVLLNTSKRVIPKNLIYIGNFPDADRPPKEFVPHTKLNIMPVSWKRFSETFETKMIEQYCGPNLRELRIYQGRAPGTAVAPETTGDGADGGAFR